MRMNEPEAFAIYNWIYDDSGSNWGHRHFNLAALSNNAGSRESEGLLGFGVKQGTGGSYQVMNVADEVGQETLPSKKSTKPRNQPVVFLSSSSPSTRGARFADV